MFLQRSYEHMQPFDHYTLLYTRAHVPGIIVRAEYGTYLYQGYFWWTTTRSTLPDILRHADCTSIPVACLTTSPSLLLVAAAPTSSRRLYVAAVRTDVSHGLAMRREFERCAYSSPTRYSLPRFVTMLYFTCAMLRAVTYVDVSENISRTPLTSRKLHKGPAIITTTSYNSR